MSEGNVFFIADTHFGSEAMIRYENRPFADAGEMEEALVENWNKVVSKEDTVYFLGDFSDGLSKEEDRGLLQRLLGKKILIMGNHDIHRTPEEWRNLGFDECSCWPIVLEGFYLLSHEPLYISTNMPYANLFGHVHGNPLYKDASPQSVCVSAERINYTPVSFDEIKERIRKEKIS